MTEPVREIDVTINGSRHIATTGTRTLLSDFLRHDAGLTGTHVGCEQGVCGACTVLLDGVPVRSCLMLAVQSDGCAVETVESLAKGDELSGFQRAMRDQHGLQCGFCTPGILMSMAAAERDDRTVEEAEQDVLGGHVCRCTGYVGIRKAIRQRWEERAVQE